MSATEKVPKPSSSLPPSPSSLELDPLLEDLNEKKLNFRKNVVSLAAELKDARNRLALQAESFSREAQSRKVAETKARSFEDEIGRLQKCLEEQDVQLIATASTSELYLRELDALRSQLSIIQATAETSATSAESAQLQCLSLLKELDEKNISLKAHETRVSNLAEQLDHLQKDLHARELSQQQLKDEVIRIEKDIMHAVIITGANKDSELKKILDEISPKNIENMNKLMNTKDEEIARLKDEIRFLSAHWKLKTKELESLIEKHQKANQELKTRVLKLEFCLQEAKTQMRKLRRTGERRGKALKDLQEQLSMKQQNVAGMGEKPNLWESSGFKIVVSMSMLVLVVITKR